MGLSIRARLTRKLTYRLDLSPLPAGTGRGVVSFTFDDFPLNAWTNGHPILRERGYRGTYYAAGRFMGREENGLAYFDAASLRAVAEAGHEIGCHTFGHESSFEASRAEYLASVMRNDAFLRDVLPGYEPTSFAFPFGHAAPGARRSLRKLFAACRGIEPRLDTDRPDASLLPAFSLDTRTSDRRDWEAIVARAAREGRWLIVFTHDVSDEPSPFGCTPAALARVADLAVGHGLEGRPVGEVVAAAGRTPPD